VLKYHQFRARLGMGDLHPGGIGATETMLGWLQQQRVQRVLEIGAGIGNTAARMAELGWDVTALEPDAVLFARLRCRRGLQARSETFLQHTTPRRYDAIIAESVFCMLDLARVFAHAKALLKPGGHLAFVEAVWTDQVCAAQSRQWHETTLRLFGIPVGSREPLTWRDWCTQLHAAGFGTVHAERLPRGSAGHPPSADWRASAVALLRDPRLMLWMARFRFRKHLARMPRGVLESWLFLGRSA